MRFVKLGLLLSVIAVISFSCGNGERKPLENLEPVNGGAFKGGTFHFNEVEDFITLYPLGIKEVVGHRIANQIYEGLFRLSQRDLSVKPCIANKWEVDSSATLYTIHLRKDVKFHDDDCFKGGNGRLLTANDVKYCFDKLCEADPKNQGFWVFQNRVEGASQYYKSTLEGAPLEEGISGVKVLDDYTIQIKLIQPFASFKYILAMPFTYIFPEEAFDKYGDNMRIKAVGTGPFRLKEVREGEAAILVRNKNYWGTDEFKNRLPYLDAVKISFIKEKKSEMLEFKKGNLDMVLKLPLEMVEEVVDKNLNLINTYKKYTLQVTPSLFLQYYGFQHQQEVFKNKLVRQAFNYAINRKDIVDYTIKGMGIPANYGVVPPALVGYDSKAIKGYVFDPDKAKQLLTEAGYPNGEGFPQITLQLNSGGGTNTQIAEAIHKMLEENLNIKIKMTVLPWGQHRETIESGKVDFWRAGWVADYPDPENFLNLFYGVHVPEDTKAKTYINTVRYQSDSFNFKLEAALQTIEETGRNKLYQEADQVAINDAVIMPIYYEKVARLLQPYVKNFFQNPMEYRSLRDVYFNPGNTVAKENEEK